MPLKYSGEDGREILRALISAYPNKSELGQMVLFVVDEPFNKLA